MENKLSVFPTRKTFSAQVKPTKVTSVLPEKHSPIQAKKKMRYFRKTARGNSLQIVQGFRKRRYCFSRLGATYLEQLAHVTNRVLTAQKSIVKLGVHHETFFRRCSTSFKCLRNFEICNLRKRTNAMAQIRNHLKSLQLFSLDFSNPTLKADNFLRILARQIGKYERYLQLLTLGFWNPNITDIGVRNLSEKIGSLRHLRRLNLHFARAGNITETGVTSLAKALGKTFKSLRRLDLSFKLLKKVTDDGVNSLAEQIGKLRSLRFLKFVLDSPVTDKGLESLAGQIGNNLSSLQNLIIFFDDNENITKSGIRKLAKHLQKNLQTMKTLDFNTSHFYFGDLPTLMRWLSENPK